MTALRLFYHTAAAVVIVCLMLLFILSVLFGLSFVVDFGPHFSTWGRNVALFLSIESVVFFVSGGLVYVIVHTGGDHDGRRVRSRRI